MDIKDVNELLRQLRGWSIFSISKHPDSTQSDGASMFMVLDMLLTNGQPLPDDWAGLSQMRQSDIERLQKEKAENL